MFTTIAKLRASSAMQSRVTTVENWLKRQNPSWTPDTKFPIAFIANSNIVADVEWVNGVTSTHASWPELANAVLAQFGHKTQTEHRHAIEEMLNARAGKTKALNDQIIPKYNIAFASLCAADFGSSLWPFAFGPAGASTPAEGTQATKAEVAQANPATVSGVVDAAPEPETAAQQTAEEPVNNFILVGAFYIAIGKIVMEKQKPFAEACTWASSPTGGRTYSQYAMENGADGAEARAFLKAFIGRAEHKQAQ